MATRGDCVLLKALRAWRSIFVVLAQRCLRVGSVSVVLGGDVDESYFQRLRLRA